MTRKLFERAVHLAGWAALSLADNYRNRCVAPWLGSAGQSSPDYYLHGIGFGVPALLAAFAARNRRNVIAVAITIILIALASELAQYFVPGRTVSAHDLAANAIGVAAGVTMGLLIYGLLSGLLATARSG